jgi:hypothetical protein
MKADNVSIAKVFSSGGDIHYVLPHFQREYTWEKEQWATLLADAFGVYQEASLHRESSAFDLTIEHFLGSIVVVHDGMVSGTVSALKLVDGQQRLVSISLILRALAQAIRDGQHAALAKKIDKFLFNADEQGDLRFKILPTTKYGDRAAYCALISGDAVSRSESRIPLAFTYFSKEIQSHLQEGLDPERFLQVLVTAFQVVFINLDPRDSPYRIFESLNAKGKPLTQGDLIRNYVAMRLPAARQEEAFVKSWRPIEELLKETRKVGRLPELTAFIRHYLAVHSSVLCEEGHVYARFRDRAEKQFGEPNSFTAELSQLAVFASHYDKLLRPAFSNVGLRDAIRRLNDLDFTTVHLFLLQVSDWHHRVLISDEQFIGIVGVLENYLVRRHLVGEPAAYLNGVFPRLASQIDVKDPVASLAKTLAAERYPSDAAVLRALKVRSMYDSASTKRRTVLILNTINRYLSAGRGGYTVLDGDATIEHVMPQTVDDVWKQELGPLWEQVSRDLLHTLGNLTLVTAEWNSTLSNSAFATKKPLLSGHALSLNHDYFGGVDGWDRNEIIRRADWLGRKILNVWPSLDPTLEPQPSEELASLEEVAEFDFEAVERVAVRVGASLRRLSKARYASPDGMHGLVGMCSRPYDSGTRADRGYWFGFRTSQLDFLREFSHRWVAFECSRPETVLLFTLEEFEPHLEHLSQTPGTHWHIVLEFEGDSVYMRKPLAGERIDVTSKLLPAGLQPTAS